MPFAVIAERAHRDLSGHLTLESITDTLVIDAVPSVAPEFHLAAIFEMSGAEAEQAKSVLTRIIDPDGAELDLWRVQGEVVPRSGSTRVYYYVLLRFRFVPFGQAGRHEIRMQYDVDQPELAVAFELKERGSDA